MKDTLPRLSTVSAVDLRREGAQTHLRHVVPAHWWQAAERAGVGDAAAGLTQRPRRQ